jgi:hypothetical protein
MGVVSDDLIAFVTARLDEDEAIARELAGWPHWHHTPAVTAHGPIILIAAGEDDEIDVASVERELPEVATHIARHDPARALRQVEDGRRLLAAYAEAREPDPEATPRERALRMAVAEVARMLVLSRAAVWSDHPDYKPEWAL